MESEQEIEEKSEHSEDISAKFLEKRSKKERREARSKEFWKSKRKLQRERQKETGKKRIFSENRRKWKGMDVSEIPFNLPHVAVDLAFDTQPDKVRMSPRTFAVQFSRNFEVLQINSVTLTDFIRDHNALCIFT
jgi:hypothetical protein